MTTPAMFDLRGRVALLTGATSGIGLACARSLGDHGASVVVVGLEQAPTDRTVEELRSRGQQAVGVAADVRRDADLVAAVDLALATYGKIDVLVCNAGVSLDTGPLVEATPDAFDATMDINVRSVFRLTNLVIPGMAAAGGGAVIIISSIAGLRGNRLLGLYGMSKAANAQLARNLAVQWGADNVRVNAISPGVIDTAFARDITADPARAHARLAKTPLGRFGQPENIAGAVVYLASAAGDFTTGQNIVIDGGTLISD